MVRLKAKTKTSALKILTYLALLVFTVAALYPLIYTITNSFIGASEFSRYYGSLDNSVTAATRNPLHIIPDRITLSGYRDVFLSRPNYLYKFWISMFLSVTILAGQMIMSILGGYAFSRFRFPCRDGLFFMIILLMTLPYQVTLVPNYIMLVQMGLIDNYAALILPGICSAFGVFLLRQTMICLPNSIFEAARLDGAGSMRALVSICLPGIKPSLAALVILSFADNWNMIEQPLAFLKNRLKYPLSLFLSEINTTNPPLTFVCGVLSVIPLLLLFSYFKEEMILGIEYTGVK